MKVTPVKGTNDYLPKEVEIRDYLQQKILEVYLANGFEHIITPVIEDIENLDKSDGGENLNLIFKIMKRGDKLDKALASGVTSENENVLADMGLRYDLTLPLSRYYANNKDKLTLPMKCIQMDRVYRAERPQKGRLREFIQCDIDIIGSESNDSEIELILTTTKALQAIGMKNFKVKLNDRRLLRAVLMQMGFAENELDSVCITFDKLDKIGMDGVEAELTEKGIEYGEVEQGIMIETPAASLMADVFAKEADFFSIGTNDLTGYTMAVDRGNAEVAYLYSAYNPAVLRSIERVIKAGRAEGIMVGMCGEAAADPLLAPLLISFGMNEFSVSATSILATRKGISLWTKEEADAVAAKAMSLTTEAEVEAYLKSVAKH